MIGDLYRQTETYFNSLKVVFVVFSLQRRSSLPQTPELWVSHQKSVGSVMVTSSSACLTDLGATSPFRHSTHSKQKQNRTPKDAKEAENLQSLQDKKKQCQKNLVKWTKGVEDLTP